MLLDCPRWVAWEERVDIPNARNGSGDGWSWWYVLFIIEAVAVLWPPFYNKVEPEWRGIPFFYWYQLLWVVISAVLTAIVYFATAPGRR
jgi:hypothetical protein